MNDGTVKTNMVRAVLGLDDFILTIVRPGWYHLWRKGGLFPLAGGPIDFIRKNFDRLTT